MKRKHALVLGAAAAGAGYLWWRSRQAEPASVSGLGAWYNPMSWGDTPSDQASAAREKLMPLYESYRVKVASLPVELATINPSRYREAQEVAQQLYKNILDADKQMSYGELDKAIQLFTNGINEIENLRMKEIDELLASAPAAIADYKARLAAATTEAQQKAAQEESRKLSQAATVAREREEYKAAGTTGDRYMAIDAAGKAVQDAAAPLNIFGVDASKGFVASFQQIVTRMKWYVIAGLGIYGAIKLGPGIIKWVQARKASKALAGGAIPSLAGESYTFTNNPRRRRRSRR